MFGLSVLELFQIFAGVGVCMICVGILVEIIDDLALRPFSIKSFVYTAIGCAIDVYIFLMAWRWINWVIDNRG